MCLNHPETTPRPRPWKNCLPQNRSLVLKRLGTAASRNHPPPSLLSSLMCNMYLFPKIKKPFKDLNVELPGT